VSLPCYQVRLRCRSSNSATSCPLSGCFNLSAVLASPNFAALFRAATVRVFPPPEVSPRKSRERLPTPPAPLQFVPSPSRRVHSSLITDGFADAPQEILGLAVFLRRLWDPFPRRPPSWPKPRVRSTFPGPPGLKQPWPPLGSGFVYFEALLLLRVRSHDSELPLTRRRSSLGFFAPLKPSPPTPRTLLTRRTALSSTCRPPEGEPSLLAGLPDMPRRSETP